MQSLRSAIQASLAEWDDPVVELATFGTADAEAIARAIEQLCAIHLGTPVRGCLFYRASVGCVAGLELDDTTRAVVKVHQRDRSVPRLRACQLVQERLVARGFPCPAPLLAPTPIAGTLATAERWLEPGERRDPRDPVARRALAEGLWRIASLAPLSGLDALGGAWFSSLPATRLWPKPHNALFDFEATSRGAEWIDALAAKARRTPVTGRRVVGHFDWRIEHVGFDGDRLCASFDYDSLHLEPEPVVVGAAAHAFTAEWDREVERPAPGPEDIFAFLRDYEAARGAPFDPAERRLVVASCVYSLAYTARCGHCGPTPRPPGRDFAPALTRMAELLDAADLRW